jgi:hypothetical protein
MNGPELTILAAFGAFAGVFLPLLARPLPRYRYRKMLRCPETGQDAEVSIDATRAAISSFTAAGLKARNCSLWPERRGCSRKCLERA